MLTIPSRLLDSDLISCTKAADASLNWERIPFILEAQQWDDMLTSSYVLTIFCNLFDWSWYWASIFFFSLGT